MFCFEWGGEEFMVEFKPNEKIQLFDKISALYFNRNFGTMSKADFETLLFSEYIEHCLNSDENIDDYVLSKQLGLTQSRIRSLKERKELKYPRKDFDWKKSLADEIKNAKYDENDRSIKVIIQDVNVMHEIRHYIENCGWYDECTQNKKLLKISLDCFIDIFIENDEIFSEETRKILENLDPDNKDIKDFLSEFSKKGFKKFLMTASEEVVTLAISVLPFGGIAKNAFQLFGNILKKMIDDN